MTVISGIVALIKAIPIVNDWVVLLIAAYIDTAKASTKSDILDAASASASATSDAERLIALDKWQKALKNKRYE